MGKVTLHDQKQNKVLEVTEKVMLDHADLFKKLAEVEQKELELAEAYAKYEQQVLEQIPIVVADPKPETIVVEKLVAQELPSDLVRASQLQKLTSELEKLHGRLFVLENKPTAVSLSMKMVESFISPQINRLREQHDELRFEMKKELKAHITRQDKKLLIISAILAVVSILAVCV